MKWQVEIVCSEYKDKTLEELVHRYTHMEPTVYDEYADAWAAVADKAFDILQQGRKVDDSASMYGSTDHVMIKYVNFVYIVRYIEIQ